MSEPRYTVSISERRAVSLHWVKLSGRRDPFNLIAGSFRGNVRV